MHIGLIVGIGPGPAATDYYYRYLISALASAEQNLTLTMAHADAPTLLRHQAAGNVDAQVEIYRQLTLRLHQSGIEQVAITSIAGHFCIDAFKAISPVPVIDLLEVVKAEMKQHGFRKVGLLGTRVVMESRFYGVLDDIEVIAPQVSLAEVHDAYISMATAGLASHAHRELFLHAGKTLINDHGCEAIMLAGTDLALVFKKDVNPGFKVFDCAQIHAQAIARVAMQNSERAGDAVSVTLDC